MTTQATADPMAHGGHQLHQAGHAIDRNDISQWKAGSAT
jgi:hypothetical protein